ncbi:MAG: hypothetical protein ACRD2B_09430 [Terriglobia bacterium]
MATLPNNLEYVIHPLDDQPEEKCNPEGLGPMPMSRSVKASLLVLRIYLITMMLLLLYHVLGLAGVIGIGF